MITLAVQEDIDKNQRTIGFNCSAAAIDMFEIYLHREGLLGLSATIKHDWFSSIRRAREKVSAEFTNKAHILTCIVNLEKKRNILVYGKQQPRPVIGEYIQLFNKIKELFTN